MKLFTTLIGNTLAFLCVGIALLASNAVAQQKTLKELIVGTWLLDSVYDQYQDGKKTNPWGPGVKGIAMYNANGWFSWQMMSADRSKTASNNPRDPVGQAIAHFGTYTVDEAAKTMSTHIERCTFPQWDGTDGTVAIAFPSEDDLTITLTKPIPDPSGGSFIPHLFLKRVR
jgi:type II secretory pathway pseudopilin PulG